MKLLDNHGYHESRQMLECFEHWLQTPLGRRLLACERGVIDAMVANLFGYQQFAFCVSHRFPVATASHLGHKVTVTSAWRPDMPDNVLVTLPDEVALTHDVADLVVLHHTLDFAPSAHHTLRDVSRIIKGSGRLLIVGFNPLSLWGLRKMLMSSGQAPWNGRFISGRRVEDWLGLLDFKIERSSYHLMALPYDSNGVSSSAPLPVGRTALKLPVGAFYAILAQKQVGCMISVRRRWTTAKIVGLSAANSFKTDI